MYGFEGLGCVYWHMVAKLLLAIQEIHRDAERSGEPADVIAGLARAYHRVRQGLGFNKTVEEYGAFPTDPYSHTPPHAGAQQPGMTGQVKEEVITRLGELGVDVEDGIVAFRPRLLPQNERLEAAAAFEFVDRSGEPGRIDVPAGESRSPTVRFRSSTRSVPPRSASAWSPITARRSPSKGDRLDAEQSRALLGRTGEIRRIDVDLP